jgi:hypothetical protein
VTPVGKSLRSRPQNAQPRPELQGGNAQPRPELQEENRQSQNAPGPHRERRALGYKVEMRSLVFGGGIPRGKASGLGRKMRRRDLSYKRKTGKAKMPQGRTESGATWVTRWKCTALCFDGASRGEKPQVSAAKCAAAT